MCRLLSPAAGNHHLHHPNKHHHNHPNEHHGDDEGGEGLTSLRTTSRLRTAATSGSPPMSPAFSRGDNHNHDHDEDDHDDHDHDEDG